MIQSNWFRAVACSMLACCVALSMNSPSVRGADAPAKESKEKGSKEKGKARGRLPPFYNKVVDDSQRTEIYKIQDKYAPQIDDLKKQLEALTAKRDAELSAVLTATQRKKVDELAAEAKATRDTEAKKKAETAGSVAKEK